MYPIGYDTVGGRLEKMEIFDGQQLIIFLIVT